MASTLIKMLRVSRPTRTPIRRQEPGFGLGAGTGLLRLKAGRLNIYDDVSYWPIATNDALTANRRFRGIADMERFSAPNDL